MTARQGYAHDRAMLRAIEDDAHCNDYDPDEDMEQEEQEEKED